MWLRNVRGVPAVGSRAYERDMHEELDHYSELLKDSTTMLEPAPAIWNAVLDKAAARIEERTGADLLTHVVTQLKRSESPRQRSMRTPSVGRS